MDIKCQNILMGLTPQKLIQLKISDFGIAKNSGDNIFCMYGTITHMAPELLVATTNNPVKLSIGQDLYSMGVLLWSLYSRLKPFRCFLTQKREEVREINMMSIKGRCNKMCVLGISYSYVCIRCTLPFLWSNHSFKNYTLKMK